MAEIILLAATIGIVSSMAMQAIDIAIAFPLWRNEVRQVRKFSLATPPTFMAFYRWQAR